MDMDSFDFTPQRVKTIRIMLGETQAQFAERVGVSGDMVHRWESGKSEPMKGPVIKALLDAEAAV